MLLRAHTKSCQHTRAEVDILSNASPAMVFQPRNRIIFREENDVNFSRCQFFTPPSGIKSMAAPASETENQQPTVLK